MKLRILYILPALMSLLVSCSKAQDIDMPRGQLDLRISSEVELSVQTRTSDFEDYNVYLSATRTGQDPYTRSLTYAEMLGGFSVPYGVFSVEAENCTPEDAHVGLGCARYYGRTDGIMVMSPDITTVTVDCSMVNSKAAITFAEDFLSEFDSGSVTADMKVGEREISVTPDASDVVYFNVDPSGSEFLYTVHGAIDGVMLSYEGNLLLKPARFARITVKSNHNGQLGPGVSVQEESEVGVLELVGEIDLGTGQEITGGTIDTPFIYIDYEINPAVDIDCILDVIK